MGITEQGSINNVHMGTFYLLALHTHSYAFLVICKEQFCILFGIVKNRRFCLWKISNLHLARWLNWEKHWWVFMRSWVQLPVPTWQLKKKKKNKPTCLLPWPHGSNVLFWCIDRHADKTPVYVKCTSNSFLKISHVLSDILRMYVYVLNHFRKFVSHLSVPKLCFSNFSTSDSPCHFVFGLRNFYIPQWYRCIKWI